MNDKSYIISEKEFKLIQAVLGTMYSNKKIKDRINKANKLIIENEEWYIWKK